MDPGDAARSASKLLVGAPTTFLPAFLVVTGSVLVPQAFVLLGLAIAALSLLGTGRIEQFSDALARLTGELGRSGTPGVEGDVDPATVQGFAEATVGLLTPEVLVILAVTGLVALLVSILVRGIAVGVRVHAAIGAVLAEAPVEVGVVGASRDWTTYVWFVVLRALVLVVPTVALLAVTTAVGVVSPALAVMVFVVGGLVWLVVILVGYLALLFVPQAIAFDDLGLWAAVRRNLGFMRAHPGRTIAYVGVTIGVWIGFGVVSWVFTLLNVDRFASVVTAVALVPWLVLFKTAIYLDAPARSVETGLVRARFRAATARGWRELWTYVGTRPGTVAGTTLVFAAGTAVGYLAAAPFSLGLPAPADAGAVFGTVPVDQFVSIASNNWLVSVTQTFAGLAFAVPALSNLLFNGLVVGLVLGIGYDLPVAIAFVLPHAVLEVPALIVSGTVGVDLGRHAWRYVRGTEEAATLAAEMRRALSVLVVLAPVFVVAAAIEAFVTPWFVTLVG